VDGNNTPFRKRSTAVHTEELTQMPVRNSDKRCGRNSEEHSKNADDPQRAFRERTFHLLRQQRGACKGDNRRQQ
jgi:hypothetical protein